jgi:hypothetical protein
MAVGMLSLYLDAGAEISYNFIAFLIPVPAGYNGVKVIQINEKGFDIYEKLSNKIFSINSNLKLN